MKKRDHFTRIIIGRRLSVISSEIEIVFLLNIFKVKLQGTKVKRIRPHHGCL